MTSDHRVYCVLRDEPEPDRKSKIPWWEFFGEGGKNLSKRIRRGGLCFGGRVLILNKRKYTFFTCSGFVCPASPTF